MLGTLIKVAVVAAVAKLVIDSIPDIKRYLEIRDMLALGAPGSSRRVTTDEEL